MLRASVPGMNAHVNIAGDTLTLWAAIPHTTERVPVQAHDVDTAPNAFYRDFEGFCQWVGFEDVRITPAVLTDGQRILYIYDWRPPFYPKISDLADVEDRNRESKARDDEPELYGPDGEMLEWQSGGNYGYGWNLDVDFNSEWGHAPFPWKGETIDDMNARHEQARQSLRNVFGDDMSIIVGPQIAAANIRQERNPS